jgi:hypothetical protein
MHAFAAWGSLFRVFIYLPHIGEENSLLSMWLYYADLLGRSADSFLSALGTTGFGWFVQGIVFFLATEIATYLAVWFFKGKVAMKDHVVGNFRVGFVAWLAVMICVYSPIFGWQVIKTIYADKTFLISENQRLNAGNSGLVDPKSRDEEIKKLLGELDKYKNAKALGMGVYPISHDIRPGVPKLEYVLTTNATRSSSSIEAACDIPIADSSILQMTKSGTSVGSVKNNRLSANKVRFDIGFPDWSPASPEWVTIFFTPPVNAMPRCSFSIE